MGRCLEGPDEAGREGGRQAKECGLEQGSTKEKLQGGMIINP